MRKAKPAKKKPVRTAQQPDPAPTPTPTPDVPPEETPPPEEPPPPPVEPAPVEPTPPVEGVVEGEVEAETEEGTVELTPEELALLKEQEEAAGEVIVVTGSAFERRELTTPAPVTVLDRADLDSAGMATVGDILQNLPAQSNAINIQHNNGGDGSTRVNLRGLGTARTLVLMNGRRLVPGGTGADASVDLNAIPLAVIERVEVLKDGASALYGSDAMGGVVNIITRTDFEGAEANFYTGMSQRGDGVAFDASFVNGAKWKKGNIVFAAGYSDLRPVWAGDREFSRAQRILDFAAADMDGDRVIGNWEEEQTVIDAGSSATPDGFLVTDEDGDGLPDPGNAEWDELNQQCPSTVCTFDPETGEWRDFNFGDETGANDFFNFQPDNYLITPLKRFNVFSTGNYELREGARAFFEAQYMNRSSDQSLAPEPIFLDQIGVAISGDSIYNPYGRDIGFYRRRLVEMGRRRSFQEVNTFRSVVGLDGELPDDLPALKNWKWELSYNFGRTNAIQMNEGNLIVSRVATALGPSMMDAGGNPICVGTPGDESTAIPDCVPLNLLGGASSNNGAGSITPEMAQYLTFTGVTSGFNEQQTALGMVRGQLAKTPWGGDVSLALGADYRMESGEFTPDPLTATGDTTGNAIEPVGGEYDVKEGFAELSFVPVIGKGAAEWVELDVALRAFDYQNFGNGVTYKFGGLFRSNVGVAVRGTYSTAFRAPSIGELYSGNFDDFPTLTDPCDTSINGPLPAGPIRDQCEAEGLNPDTFQNPVNQIRTEVGGNPNLQEETAKILTAGIVIEPKPVKGLSLTIDYFNFAIKDSIQPVGADIILQNCYQLGDQASCAKVHRRSNGVIDHISDVADNVGANDTSGIDMAIAYDHSRPFGRLRHQLEGTYLLTYTETQANGQVIDGVGVYDLGVNPRIKANFSTMWAKAGWNAGLNIRYIHSMRECEANFCFVEEGTPADMVPITRDVDRNITADLFGGYTLKSSAGTTTLGIGINNVMDQDPPKIYNGFLAESDASTYDYLGRYYYFRASQLF